VLQVFLRDEPVSDFAKDQTKIESISRNSQAFVRMRDSQGQVIERQYGMSKTDGSVQFVFTDGAAPSYEKLFS